jgi:hypothetical protein
MSDNVKLTSTEGEMKQRLDKRLRNSGEGGWSKCDREARRGRTAHVPQHP